jgi:hypothetical protein
VRALERAPAGATAAPAQAVEAPGPRAAAFDPLHITTNLGRALIVLGGAFLLRALTDAGTWLPAVGVAIGLAYALTWTVTSARAARGGDRMRAAFDGGVSLAIGFPLLVEASLKFGLFSPAASAVALGAFTAVVLVAAGHGRLPEVGWLGGLGGTVTGLVLMVRTDAVVPYSFYFTSLGVGALWLGYVRNWFGLRWPIGVVAAFVVFGVTLRAMATPPVTAAAAAWASQAFLVVAYLGSIAVRTLVRGRPVIVFEIVQTMLALIVGLGGAMTVGHTVGGGDRLIGVTTFALGVATYAVAFQFVARQAPGALNFYFYSSLALLFVMVGAWSALPEAPRALALTTIGLVLATAWSRSSRLTLGAHTALVVAAASWASGLVSLGLAVLTGALPSAEWSEWPALVTFAAVLALSGSRVTACRWPSLTWSDFPGVILGAIASTGLAGLVTLASAALINAVSPPVDSDMLTTIRTASLSLLVVACARLPRTGRFSAMSRLAYPLLIIAGVKLVAVDLRYSEASTLFAALAFYGAALLLVPRLRRAPPR